jgi:aldehyde:ferredoxin oxidoreductase
VLCRFCRDLHHWDELATIIKVTTGLELDKEQMAVLASGVADDTRRFNLREGLEPADDHLPARFHQEALPETGKSIAAQDMEVLLKEYYLARGWDEDGRPPEDCTSYSDSRK